MCKFVGGDEKHEMRHELEFEVKKKHQTALQFTTEKVARGMDE